MNNGDLPHQIPLRRQVMVAGGIIILAGLMSYSNSFAGPFVRDDVPSIVQNSTIRHLEKIGSVLNPAQNSLVGGRPLVNLSYALNYAISGTSVWSYHVLNLLIHLLAGLILFGVVRRTLLLPPLQRRFGQAALPLAIVVTILWIVHPLQTDAVTYISERAESLMGLFYLLTLYGFIRGASSSTPCRWFAFSATACCLGVLAKEVIVTAPLIVLLYDRTFISGSFSEAWRKHRWLYWALLGSWLLTIRLLAGINDRGVGYGLGISWWTYALTECRVVAQYLCLAFWPHSLVIDHGTSWAKNAREIVPYACVLVLLMVGTTIALYRRTAVGFLGAWVFLILTPTSSVVPIAFEPMGEHRMYLPLAALVVLFVIGVYSWIGQKSVILFSILAVTMGLATRQRNDDYRTEIALWTDQMHKRPENAYAHVMVGVSLLHLGRTAEATEQFQEAERLDQTMDMQFKGIGVGLLRNGQPTEAIKYFKAAVQMKPDSIVGHYYLGIINAQLGMLANATAEFNKALSIDPNFEPARAQLSRLNNHNQ
ncbi:MAG TPA: tetratricopeptide repeat protein [Opitutaceae bacterium]|nr:tetratricopeptide repeat protein [Opitutaceae bacterium]